MRIVCLVSASQNSLLFGLLHCGNQNRVIFCAEFVYPAQICVWSIGETPLSFQHPNCKTEATGLLVSRGCALVITFTVSMIIMFRVATRDIEERGGSLSQTAWPGRVKKNYIQLEDEPKAQISILLKRNETCQKIE